MPKKTSDEPRYASRAEFENRPTTIKEGIPIIIGVVMVAIAIVFTTYLLSKGASA